MAEEIERKFLVKVMPDLTSIPPVKYERYYLERSNGREDRVQHKGDKYEREQLTGVSDLSRTKTRTEITKQEFDNLKQNSSEAIIRDSYPIAEIPNCSIKIYHGRFEGLARIEVEFDSENEAKAFAPLEWFGREITGTALNRDSQLLNLSEEEFKNLLKS